MNCDDFLKIFDINNNCKWDTGLILNNDKNIKWDFKILNSLKYIFDAYNFENKNIFSGFPLSSWSSSCERKQSESLMCLLITS